MQLSRKKQLANRLLPHSLELIRLGDLVWDIASEYESDMTQAEYDQIMGRLLPGLSWNADAVRQWSLDTLESDIDEDLVVSHAKD